MEYPKSMKYPKRTLDHVKETESYKILNNYIPSQWMLRDVTERDYGIDLYVEIIEDNGDVTGKLASIQVKSSSKIDYLKKNPDTAMHYDIDISTTNFWYNIPVPVFLIYVDINSQDALIISVKDYIRKNFSDFISQGSFNYAFNKSSNLRSLNAENIILSEYNKEINRKNFEYYLLDLFSNYDHLFEVLSYHQHRDAFYELEINEALRLQSWITKINFLTQYLNMDNTINLKEFLDDAKEKFGKRNLHELQAASIVKMFINILPELFNNAKLY